MTLRLVPTIKAAGLYDDIPDEVYHADPVVTPSLSSSIAKIIIGECPRVAWDAHPRLNMALLDEVRKPPTPAMDAGTAAHRVILGKGQALKEIVADDYKTKAAQNARDDARRAGMVPVLSHLMPRVHMQREAFFDQIQGTDVADLFNDGVGEVTGVWQDLEDVWCRMRIDWLPNAARAGGHVDIVDVKTTDGSAEPELWERNAFKLGYDVQDAFYQRGVREIVKGVRSVTMYFVVLEQNAPFCMSIHRFGGQAYAEAEGNIDMAIGTWADCLEKNRWPGYPKETTHIDPPKWQSGSSAMRKMRMQRYLEIVNRPQVRKAVAAAS